MDFRSDPDLKDLLCGTIKEMMEAEMDDHLNNSTADPLLLQIKQTISELSVMRFLYSNKSNFLSRLSISMNKSSGDIKLEDYLPK